MESDAGEIPQAAAEAKIDKRYEGRIAVGIGRFMWYLGTWGSFSISLISECIFLLDAFRHPQSPIYHLSEVKSSI